MAEDPELKSGWWATVQSVPSWMMLLFVLAPIAIGVFVVRDCQAATSPPSTTTPAPPP